jgi:hypothetical protein
MLRSFSVRGRIALVVVLLVACSERGRHGVRAVRPSKVERGLAAAVGARLGVSVIVGCAAVIGMPSSCVATLPDGMRLPLRITFVSGAWEFALVDPILTTEPIIEYVTGELADLGIADRVSCGPRIQRIDPLHPIECTLARGGMAFVSIAADGAIRDLELALDPISATARSEELTAARAAELTEMSKRLEHLPDDED